MIYLIHPVDFVLLIRMIGDGDGRASADDVSGESKVPSEEKSTVIENTSAPVTDIAPVTTHREEKREPQTTIKTLMPVIRSPSHAQEISATERLAFSSVSLILSFNPFRKTSLHSSEEIHYHGYLILGIQFYISWEVPHLKELVVAEVVLVDCRYRFT
jgi:hypothetical protein